jgi:uncharacterized protein (DUF58 family)
VPTREGTAILILAGAVFFLATNLASGLLFVFDAMLLALAIVGAATSALPVIGLAATRQAPSRAHEGTPMSIEIALAARHGGRFLLVEDGWRGARARTLLPMLSPGARTHAALGVVPVRRGRHAIGPIEVKSRGLLGLFNVRRRLPVTDEVIVWPQCRPVPPDALARLRTALGGASAERSREPEEFYGVRDYRPGDSLARVHWRSTVRRGTLVVREFERTSAPAVTLVVDLDRRQRSDRLDALVRAAASVLHVAREQGLSMAVAGWDEGPIRLHGWEAAMDWLALAAPSGPSLSTVLPALDGAGSALIVVASTADTPRPAHAAVIVPAEELARVPSVPTGLAYTADGTVVLW